MSQAWAGHASQEGNDDLLSPYKRPHHGLAQGRPRPIGPINISKGGPVERRIVLVECFHEYGDDACSEFLNETPHDAGSVPGIANAVQQVGGAFGIVLIGLVFFGRVAAFASSANTFRSGVWLQLALPAGCALLTPFLQRRIAAEAYAQNR